MELDFFPGFFSWIFSWIAEAVQPRGTPWGQVCEASLHRLHLS